jgi:hypothetical protein
MKEHLMTIDTKDHQEHEPNEIDPDLLERALSSFQTVLSQPFTVDRVNHWLAENERYRPILTTILSRTVWGEIRWQKALGRPFSPTLASAFVIEHSHQQSVMEYVGGGVKFIDILAPHPEPSKWDGPDDEEYYRVSFKAETPQGYPTRIRVNFAAQVGWEHQGRGFRFISPPEKQFLKSDKFTVLEPFEIVMLPLSQLATS